MGTFGAVFAREHPLLDTTFLTAWALANESVDPPAHLAVGRQESHNLERTSGQSPSLAHCSYPD